MKLGPERTQKILNLKSKSERKSQQVKLLKSEMLDLQTQTGEQLASLMEQISQLTTQVQDQITKKENDKKKWEESQLATSEINQNPSNKQTTAERQGGDGSGTPLMDPFENDESINLSSQYEAQSRNAMVQKQNRLQQPLVGGV